MTLDTAQVQLMTLDTGAGKDIARFSNGTVYDFGHWMDTVSRRGL